MTRTPAQTFKSIATATVGLVIGAIAMDAAITVAKNAFTKAEPAPVASPVNQAASSVSAWAPVATNYFCTAMDQGMDAEAAGEDAGLSMAAYHEELTKEMLEAYNTQRKQYLKALFASVKSQCPEHLS